MITRELVGISRSDASIAPTSVGCCLEAWITCGSKITVNIWITENTTKNICTYAELGDKQDSLRCSKRKYLTQTRVTGVWLCCPLTVTRGTVGDMQVGDILHLWSGFLHKNRAAAAALSLSPVSLSAVHTTQGFSFLCITPGVLTSEHITSTTNNLNKYDCPSPNIRCLNQSS